MADPNQGPTIPPSPVPGPAPTPTPVPAATKPAGKPAAKKPTVADVAVGLGKLGERMDAFEAKLPKVFSDAVVAAVPAALKAEAEKEKPKPEPEPDGGKKPPAKPTATIPAWWGIVFAIVLVSAVLFPRFFTSKKTEEAAKQPAPSAPVSQDSTPAAPAPAPSAPVPEAIDQPPEDRAPGLPVPGTLVPSWNWWWSWNWKWSQSPTTTTKTELDFAEAEVERLTERLAILEKDKAVAEAKAEALEKAIPSWPIPREEFQELKATLQNAKSEASQLRQEVEKTKNDLTSVLQSLKELRENRRVELSRPASVLTENP